jgi:protein-disulfide isomerase
MASKKSTKSAVADARRSGTSANLNVTLAVVLAIVLIGAAVLTTRSGDAAPSTQAAPTAAAEPQVVRENSHFLDRADQGDVTLVEFLDFECESCRALFPVVEEVRNRYQGRINFVIRYFPIESHTNAVNAALAVEAAAQQDQIEPMYKRMYETQSEWGEQQTSRADLFRQFAEDLGLDMDQYDRDVAAPETLERVRLDQSDGLGLDVQGTPTFFLNDTKLELSSVEDLTNAIDKALEGQ